ncbi:MAG: 4Fe-4S dicluster domain-containing protein [Bacteroidota bacterium]
MNTLETKENKIAKGIVIIHPDECKGCDFCIEFCPFDVLEFSDEFNKKGYHYPIVVRAEDCTGCDLCGLYCPDFAIFGVRIKDLVKKGIDPSQVKKIIL